MAEVGSKLKNFTPTFNGVGYIKSDGTDISYDDSTFVKPGTTNITLTNPTQEDIDTFL